jgi:hypothetical protein
MENHKNSEDLLDEHYLYELIKSNDTLSLEEVCKTLMYIDDILYRLKGFEQDAEELGININQYIYKVEDFYTYIKSILKIKIFDNSYDSFTYELEYINQFLKENNEYMIGMNTTIPPGLNFARYMMRWEIIDLEEIINNKYLTITAITEIIIEIRGYLTFPIKSILESIIVMKRKITDILAKI